MVTLSACLVVFSVVLSTQETSGGFALQENSNNLLLNQRERNSTIDEVPTKIVDSDYVSIELNNFIENLTFYYYSLGNNMFLVADLAEIESAESNYHYLTEINGSNTDGLYQVEFTSSAKTKYIQYRSTHEHTVAFTTAGSTGVRIDMKIYNASDDILFYRAFFQGTSEQIFTFGEGEFYKIVFEYVGTIAQGVKISELIYYELK